MSRIKIIHLSDLHLSETSFTAPLRALLDKLTEMRQQEPEGFDLLVITGDLRNKGVGSYDPVRKFIDKLCESIGLSKSRVFLVPGNHDCNRKEVNDANWAPTAVHLTANPVEGFGRLSPAARRQSWPGFHDFIKLSSGYALHSEAGRILTVNKKKIDEPLRPGEYVPGFEQTDITIKDVPFRLVGVNSALTEVNGESTKPIAGHSFLEDALNVSSDTLPLVASHYPVNDLHPGEQLMVRQLLSTSQALMLSGHIHDTTTARGGITQGSLELGAGSSKGMAWQDHQHCRVIELDADQELVRLHDLIWWPDHGKWRCVEPLSVDWERWKRCCAPAKTPGAGRRPNRDPVVMMHEAGVEEICSSRTDSQRVQNIEDILNSVAPGSDLLVLGRSLRDWARHHKDLECLINEKGLNVTLGLLQHTRCENGETCVSPSIEPPIRDDWALRDVPPSMELLHGIKVHPEAKGSLRIYGLPFYLTHSFVAYTDKQTGRRHCIEEFGIARFSEKRPMLHVSAGPDTHGSDSYARSLEETYRKMLTVDRLQYAEPALPATAETRIDSHDQARRGCRYYGTGLYHIHNRYQDFKTPEPTFCKEIVLPPKQGTEIFIVARSLVQLGSHKLGYQIADAIQNHGYKCSFLIADPTRSDVSSLVEDYATVDLIRNTWPSMQEVFSKEIFTRESATGGYLEIYGVSAYVPDTYASYRVDGKRYCVLEPGIGVLPDERPKLCFIDVPNNDDCVYRLTETIYRDILNHCRATQEPLLGMKIDPDKRYKDRLAAVSLSRTNAPISQKILRGNAADPIFSKGWFVGHFLKASNGLCRQDDVEVKYGFHRKGDERSQASRSDFATTVALLVKGRFRLEFPDENLVEELGESGDFVIYQHGVLHRWQVLADDTIVVTVRWPSRVPASF